MKVMRVLYIVPAMFPYGWAYAARARNIAKMICESGHDVTVMSDYLSDDLEWLDNNYAKDGDIEIITTSCLKASERRLIDKILVSIRLKKKLTTYLKNNQVDCIICDQTANKYLIVSRIVKNIGIPFIIEICEWYSWKNWKYGVFDFRYWQFIYCWQKKIKFEENIICISTKLEKYFYQENKNIIRIPGILDTQYKTPKLYDKLHKTIKLVFIGGVTGGKDELSNLIEVICEYNLPFSLEIYGPSKEDIYNIVHLRKIVRQTLEDKVHIHGFINQKDLHDQIKECDYGIIIRPKRRSSDAGFPTKLGEYLIAGLPILANDTGDICLYIKDGENGFILKNNSKKSILNTLNRIVDVNEYQYRKMSTHARRTAINYLDYRRYQEKINLFLKKIVERGRNEP